MNTGLVPDCGEFKPNTESNTLVVDAESFVVGD